MMSEVIKLLNKGIVTNTGHNEGEVTSPIFLRSKPDWTNQVILNLKDLNQSLEHSHYKMETIHSVAHSIQQNYYMLKTELKNAYYSVKILEEHKKFLKCFAGYKPLKFVVLPNGLSLGARKFTELTKYFLETTKNNVSSVHI